MGITRSITRIHPLLCILVLMGCMIAASWGLVSAVKPKIEDVVCAAADRYDAFLPEIVLKNGTASIKREQPFFVDTFGEKDMAFVIDTRPESVNKAMDYLKDVEVGAVLTRESFVTKSSGQYRVIPLKGFPDLTVNSTEIRAMAEEYIPVLYGWLWIIVLAYFVFAKSIQVLVFSLIPNLGARAYSVPLTYGQALKIGTVAMVPPVLADLVLGYMSLWILGSLLVYFGLYIGFLALATGDLVRSSQDEPPALTGVAPR